VDQDYKNLIFGKVKFLTKENIKIIIPFLSIPLILTIIYILGSFFWMDRDFNNLVDGRYIIIFFFMYFFYLSIGLFMCISSPETDFKKFTKSMENELMHNNKISVTDLLFYQYGKPYEIKMTFSKGIGFYFLMCPFYGMVILCGGIAVIGGIVMLIFLPFAILYKIISVIF